MNFDSYSFFDGTAMIPVTQVTWANYWKGIIPDGVVAGVGDEMQVYADSTGMQVKVKTGACIADNHRAVITSPRILSVSAASDSKPRIDIVVARVVYGNENASYVELAVKEGTAADNPVAPSVTQSTGSTYEIKLAEIYVAANVVTLAPETVTDCRNIFTAGRQSIAFMNADTEPLEKGMLVTLSQTVTDAVVRCSVGRIPVGVVQSDYIAVGARGQIETHPGNVAEIKCISDKVVVGDALVQSDTPGIARAGSGFAGGLALAAKAAGAVGNVRSLLTFFSKLPTQNKWYLLTGLQESDVICAFQFIGMDSEADALKSVNEIQYTLTKTGVISWNQTRGFYISGSSAHNGLVCDSIKYNMWGSAVSAAFGYHYAVAPTNEAIGVDLYDNDFHPKMLKLVGHRYYGNNPQNIQTFYLSPVAGEQLYYSSAALGSKISGVLATDWISYDTYHNGEKVAQTKYTNTESIHIEESPVLFGVGAGTESSVNGYLTAAVIYSVQLDAAQHLELADNIRALGGV